jgi:hypothetical protein
MARKGDHCILRDGYYASPLVHLVMHKETSGIAGRTACVIPHLFTSQTISVLDERAEAPVTCLWCLTGIEY